MLQQSYGKYIRDDSDALLRAYVTSAGEQETAFTEQETETFLDESVNYAGKLVVPTGIEPVFPT
jgi:hypothetical protein